MDYHFGKVSTDGSSGASTVLLVNVEIHDIVLAALEFHYYFTKVHGFSTFAGDSKQKNLSILMVMVNRFDDKISV